MNKKITAFYLNGCPYCRQARKALEDLINEDNKYSHVIIDWIEEENNPQISEKYNYYYVPAMFIDNDKLYEAQPGENYETCRQNIKRVLDSALS